MKNFHGQADSNRFPSSPAHQRVDPNAHTSNWYSQPIIDPLSLYPDPPTCDMPMSLFDSSEQQYLSGFFDNLVEDKNEFILPTGLDFSALVPNWSGISTNFSSQPKPQMHPYGLQSPSPFYHHHQPESLHHSSGAGFHAPQPYPLSNEPHAHNSSFIASPIKYQPACEQLSSLSDSSSSTPLCNINEPSAASSTFVTRNFPIDHHPHLPDSTPCPASIPEPVVRVSSEDSKSSKQGRASAKDDERKEKHTASEQKRRDFVRRSFDQLAEMVPDLKQSNSSKASILNRVAEYMQEVEAINRELLKQKELLRIQCGFDSNPPPPFMQAPCSRPISETLSP